MIAIEKGWPGDSISLKKVYQFVIIGGGLHGCALFADLAAKYSNQVLLITSNAEPSSLYTSGNNGYFNTAINTPLNSIENQCIKRGRERMNEILESYTSKNEQPPFFYQNNGTLLVAWTKSEKLELPKIAEIYKQNGIEVKLLSKNEVFEYEPFLRHDDSAEDQEKRKVKGALYIADEYAALDPHLFVLFLLNRGIEQGGKVLCNAFVSSAQFIQEEQHWKLSTSLSTSQNAHSQLLDFTIKTKYVINISEINGDNIEMTLMKNSFPSHPILHTIPPKRGQYIVFEKESSDIINGTILSVPTSTDQTPIIVSKSVFGNIIAGPTVDDLPDSDINLDEEDVLEEAYRILTTLRDYKLIGTYTALRPGTEYTEGDYKIEAFAESNYIRVASTRLSGLTGTLGISEYVINLFDSTFLVPNKSNL